MIKDVSPTNTHGSVSKISQFHGGGGFYCVAFLLSHVTHVMLIFKRLRLYCEMSYSESDSLGSSLLYFGFNIQFFKIISPNARLENNDNLLQ